jgi:VanZ family protein
MNRRRSLWAWLFGVQLVLLATASVVATLGHLPTTAFQRAPFDKVGHLLGYGGLAFFAVAFLGPARRWRAVAVLIAVATAEELSQRAFPTRTFDLGDLAMNIVGIVTLGAAAARLSFTADEDTRS